MLRVTTSAMKARISAKYDIVKIKNILPDTNPAIPALPEDKVHPAAGVIDQYVFVFVLHT
jgi:hypothetical protein